MIGHYESHLLYDHRVIFTFAVMIREGDLRLPRCQVNIQHVTIGATYVHKPCMHVEVAMISSKTSNVYRSGI
jgi:hypothetical protein